MMMLLILVAIANLVVLIFIGRDLKLIGCDLKQLVNVLTLQQKNSEGFDALYAVFTKKEIDHCLQALKLWDRDATALLEKIYERADFRARDFNSELKCEMKHYTFHAIKVREFQKITAAMIEGNASVLSGQKTIDEVKTHEASVQHEFQLPPIQFCVREETEEWIQRLKFTDEELKAWVRKQTSTRDTKKTEEWMQRVKFTDEELEAWVRKRMFSGDTIQQEKSSHTNDSEA
jgi:hypothetical protein